MVGLLERQGLVQLDSVPMAGLEVPARLQEQLVQERPRPQLKASPLEQASLLALLE